MKKYSILIISFVLSIVIFVVLILVQKNILNQQELIEAYVLNANVSAYDNITIEMLDCVYVSNGAGISDNRYCDMGNLNLVVAKQNFTKGKILFKDDLIQKDEIYNSIDNVMTEKVIVPISNIDNAMKAVLNSNSYINIYVTVNKEYEPHDISNYKKINLFKEDKNTTTFLYLNKIKPICFLNDNGQVVNDNSLIKSIVVEINNEQAIYINYIKGKAGFNITAI